MKKHILWLSFLFLLVMAACVITGMKTGLPHTEQQPAQELLFLRTYENWAWGVSKRASVIAADGTVSDVSNVIYENDSRKELKADWGSALAQAEQTLSGSPDIPQADRQVMYAFLNAPAPDAELGKYVNHACDYGTDALYLLQKQADGSYNRLLLCIHGDNAAVLQDKRVRQFCNWMIQHDYFQAFGTYPAE